LDNFVKALDDVFQDLSDLELQQSNLIQEIARHLGYNQTQILAIMEDGLDFNYQEKFLEQKQIYTNFNKELVESLEQKLNKIKFEEIPKKYELAYKIKDEENDYKTELEEIRLKREQGIKEDPEDIDLDNKDDYVIQKEKQKKKKIRDEKYKRIEQENKKKKEHMLIHNLMSNTIIEDYLVDEDSCEDYEDFYDLYEEDDYENDENYYETDNIIIQADENKEFNFDEKKEMNLELEIENFVIKKNDLLSINEFINDLVDDLYCLETQPNYENEKKIERITIEANNNLYFAEYGSKYKSLILTDETDFIDLSLNDKELYDFFSKYIKNEQIIEIFELIY
jgi:hypothetical protein